jgi:MFS family permease
MNSVTIFTWLGMTKAGLYVFSIFFGFFQGAMISVQNAALASICKDMREIGTMMGMGGGIVAIAGLTGTPIAGAILHAQGGNNPSGMVGFSAGIIAVGTIFVFLARMNAAKWKVFVKV